jgi:hypothetical protein
MNDDQARKAILARRARFIAAAAVGAGLAGCDGGKSGEPTVCLTVATQVPVETAPTVCLAYRPPPPDAGPDAGPRPAPCLEVKPRAR